MRVTRFTKWSVEGGAEGYQIDLFPEDIGQGPAGEINLALDQARILFYLTTYLLYCRMLNDKLMTQEQFDAAMSHFGYESRLVNALMSKEKVEVLKSKVKKTTPADEGPDA